MLYSTSRRDRAVPWAHGLNGHLLRYHKRMRIRTLQRRKQILLLRRKGLSFRAIGEQLGISGPAVFQNWKAIWSELHCHEESETSTLNALSAR